METSGGIRVDLWVAPLLLDIVKALKSLTGSGEIVISVIWVRGGLFSERSLQKDSIISAASCIRIISERGEDLPSEFQQARELIKNAKALYFLGFGYHELNMKRLGVEKLERKPTKMMGTIYGLDYQRIREVEKLNIRGDFCIRHGGLVHKPVYEFLYDYIDFNDEVLPDKNMVYK